MAFIGKTSGVQKGEELQKAPPSPTLDLTKSEIEMLLYMIKDTHFKGEHVQRVFNLVLKLQEHHSKLP